MTSKKLYALKELLSLYLIFQLSQILVFSTYLRYAPRYVKQAAFALLVSDTDFEQELVEEKMNNLASNIKNLDQNPVEMHTIIDQKQEELGTGWVTPKRAFLFGGVIVLCSILFFVSTEDGSKIVCDLAANLASTTSNHSSTIQSASNALDSNNAKVVIESLSKHESTLTNKLIEEMRVGFRLLSNLISNSNRDDLSPSHTKPFFKGELSND
jgi:hypothetical protein